MGNSQYSVSPGLHAKLGVTPEKLNEIVECLRRIVDEKADIDDRMIAIERLGSILSEAGEATATQFVQCLLEDPQFSAENQKNTYFESLYGLASRHEFMTGLGLEDYINLLAHHCVKNIDLQAKQIEAGLPDACINILIAENRRRPKASSNAASKSDFYRQLPVNALLDAMLVYSYHEEFAIPFYEAEGPVFVNNMAESSIFTEETTKKCITLLSLLAHWKGSFCRLLPQIVAVMFGMLNSSNDWEKDAALVVLANSLVLAPSQSEANANVKELQNVSITTPLIANLTPSNPLESTLSNQDSDGPHYVAHGKSVPQDPAYAIHASPSMTAHPDSPNNYLLLNTLKALAMLAKFRDHAIPILSLGFPRLLLIVHRANQEYIYCSYAITTMANAVVGVQIHPLLTAANIIKIIMKLLVQQPFEDADTYRLLLALASGAQLAAAKDVRVAMLGSPEFPGVLRLLHHESAQVNLAFIKLLINLCAEKEILPQGPRDVIIVALCQRINLTSTGQRDVTNEQKKVYLHCFVSLSGICYEDSDAALAVTHLLMDPLYSFMDNSSFGTRNEILHYLNPILRRGLKDDPEYLDKCARTIQKLWSMSHNKTPQGIQKKKLNMLSICAYEKLAIEEEWYQGIQTMKRKYLMKFV